MGAHHKPQAMSQQRGIMVMNKSVAPWQMNIHRGIIIHLSEHHYPAMSPSSTRQMLTQALSKQNHPCRA